MLNNQKGHALFYLLIIFPILTSFSVIIFDISQWQGTKNTLQSHVDTIATLASRSLPDTELARQQITEFVATLPGVSVSPTDPFVVSPNEIRFTLEAKNSAVFDFLLRAAGFSAVVFESKQEARVQVIPGDYVLILSDSASLRPQSYTAWGSATQWPASTYFNFVAAPLASDSPDVPQYSASQWQQNSFQRWATQQCFNPVFSPMKLAAAILADALQKANNNRVSALFTPGAIDGDSFEQLRPLQFVVEEPSASPLWFANASASWFGDEACIYLADPQQDGSGVYSFAGELRSFSHTDPECERAVLPLYLSHHVASGRVTDCFRHSVSLPERLYYRSAQDVAHDSSGDKLQATLTQALSMFSYAAGNESEGQQQLRGNLRAIAQRQIVAIVDTLPNANAHFSEFLQLLQAARAKLTLLYVAEMHLDEYQAGLGETLERRFLDLEELRSDSFSIYRVDDAQLLLSDALPQILKESREIAISK